MSKTTTVYNKSLKTFVISKELTIKPKSHLDIPSDTAESLVKKYPLELTNVKTGVTNSESEAEKAALEKERAKLAEDVKKFEEAVKTFEAEKAALEKAKTDTKKAN